jgi:hypothetical protein
VKLGIKEKRQEKGMEKHREDRILLEGDFNGRIGKEEQESVKRTGGMGKENPKTSWKMQMEWIEENGWED